MGASKSFETPEWLESTGLGGGSSSSQCLGSVVSRGPLGLGDEVEEQKGSQLPGVCLGEQAGAGTTDRLSLNLPNGHAWGPTAGEDARITHPGDGTHDRVFIIHTLWSRGCLLSAGFHSKRRNRCTAVRAAQTNVGKLPPTAPNMTGRAPRP